MDQLRRETIQALINAFEVAHGCHWARRLWVIGAGTLLHFEMLGNVTSI